MRFALLFLVACAHAPVDHEAVLRRQTQELLDAVGAGNKAIWDRYLDPRVRFVSEAGEVETKETLLAQIEPLPAGIDGRLVAGPIAIQRFGDTAIIVETDDEALRYFGQAIAARYFALSVWHLADGRWRLIGRQVHAALQDPPEITLPDLAPYAGTYQLAANIAYTIRVEGDHLVGQRPGRPAVVLAAEAPDVFFVRGQPRTRKVFLRDARGVITGFADRREARDIVWTREAQ